MTITLEIEYEDAVVLRDLLRVEHARFSEYLAYDVKCAIDAENERRWEQQQEALMESGGPDDSAHRRDMKDAGRGHLLR